MEFVSILVFILCVFSNFGPAFTQDYDALAVIDSFSFRDSVTLPYKAVELNGQILYPDIYILHRKLEYLFLCPARTKGESSNRNSDSENAFHLEQNPSTEDSTKCSQEVKPVLSRSKVGSQFAPKCGKSADHLPYEFGFIHRQSTDFITFVNTDLWTLSLYSVCFDTKNRKTLWTKHRVRTGLMLQGNGLPTQRIQPPYELSTEQFSFPERTFSRQAEKYGNQKTGTYKMIPQMLVPEEDFALKIWKKSTTHYANTAPLWENLIPVMTAINEGIRKVGILANVIEYSLKSNPDQGLDIYTRVFSHSHQSGLMSWIDTNNFYKKNQFGLNIWCKFIHYASQNKGIMIYLHNMPYLPPKEIVLTSEGSRVETLSENAECETPVYCDFSTWSDLYLGLTDDLSNYAYCCEVNHDKVEALFKITLNPYNEIQLLDINRIINEGLI